MTLKAKEEGCCNLIKAQVLVSPMTDAADLSRPSYEEFRDDIFEDKACMEVRA